MGPRERACRVENCHTGALGRITPDRIESFGLPGRLHIGDCTHRVQKPEQPESVGHTQRRADRVLGIEEEGKGHTVFDEFRCLKIFPRPHAEDTRPNRVEICLVFAQLREEFEAGKSTVVPEHLDDEWSTGEVR